MSDSLNEPVIVLRKAGLSHIVLNRPKVLNSLNVHMVHMIDQALDEAESSQEVRLVIISGTGPKGFCAGGDIRLIAKAVGDDSRNEAMQFFEDEYRLDFRIHNFPKPVVVIADGITMGGGLGISAGADMVIATERTRMAMPETRIGFFPDVGATGWLFRKCPPGYPEFLALTGYEATGAECVRLGLATHLAPSGKIGDILNLIKDTTEKRAYEKALSVQAVSDLLNPMLIQDISGRPDMDAWVRAYFSGRSSVPEILSHLKQCSIEQDLCKGVFERLSQRSPSATVWTLALLRYNESRELAEVFRTDLKASRYLTSRHDFREGVRARLIDRDDRPDWIPATFEEAARLFDPSDVFTTETDEYSHCTQGEAVTENISGRPKES